MFASQSLSSDRNSGSGILVRKYGGSSLADVERIRAVARDLRRAREAGHQVVVVVSAMGRTTDELTALARQASSRPPRRELDMLLSVGERITMSLLSMALADEGCPAISYTGSQCGIITDASHTDARILEVRGDRVREALADGRIVVVAGYQGVSRDREITTLGRGGSDTTAVALAAALGAVRCEILKDVDGVMTADPALVPEARRHQTLSWAEMEQIAASGCGVVHLRAVEYARDHQVPLIVRSSFHDETGTTIGTDASESTEGSPAGATHETAPSDRQNRYRPLVMHVHRQVTRLRMVTSDPVSGRLWRNRILDRLDPADTIAEWLDAGVDFRWEVLAPAPSFAGLRQALGPQSPEPAAGGDGVRWETGLGCISLAGGRPDSWLEVLRHLDDLFVELGCRGWRLRADGSTLRVLLPEDFPEDLPQRLHQSLLPA